MQFVRLGGLLVDLEQCALQVGTETGGGLGIMVILHTQILHTFFENKEPDEYAALKSYMDQQPTLADVLAEQENQRRRNVIDAAFDPFIDSDKIMNLYSLFYDLPDHRRLVLCIESEDMGSIRQRGSYEPVLSWDNVHEAIDLLASYRKQALSQ